MIRFTTEVRVNPDLKVEDFYEPDEIEEFNLSGASLTTVSLSLWMFDTLLETRGVDGLPDNNPALIDYVLHDLADAIIGDAMVNIGLELEAALSEVLIRT